MTTPLSCGVNDQLRGIYAPFFDADMPCSELKFRNFRKEPKEQIYQVILAHINHLSIPLSRFKISLETGVLLYTSDMNLDRRDFLRKAAAALAGATVLGENTESAEVLKYVSSELSPESISAHKERAIRTLMKSIPQSRKFDYLRAYEPYLKHESQMYIPGPQEIGTVTKKSGNEFNAWCASLPTNGHGLFIFADAQGGKRMQRMYVLKRTRNSQIQFIKAYKVSLSREGFGNEKDSSKTPLSEHTIQSKTIGRFGELVSKKKTHKDDERLFKHARIEGKDHWFVNSFGYEKDNELAEVVTHEFLLVGPTTGADRGVRIHGTNRSGGLGERNEWISYLDGESLSTACIRMSNVDVADLNLNKFADRGVTVFIYATPEAESAITRFTGDNPAGRWNPNDYK